MTADMTSSDIVNYVLQSEKIDTIMHFAAQSHVGSFFFALRFPLNAVAFSDNSFGNSFQFTMSNVFGTHVLLEAAKNAGGQIRRFIHVSTDEVYGESTIDSGEEVCKMRILLC